MNDDVVYRLLMSPLYLMCQDILGYTWYTTMRTGKLIGSRIIVRNMAKNPGFGSSVSGFSNPSTGC